MDLIAVEIGGKDDMSEARINDAARAVKLAHRVYPGATIMLSMHGYDDDKRELWQIRSAIDYIRKFAKLSGLHDWQSTTFNQLYEDSKGLLIACEAIDEPHPYSVKYEGTTGPHGI